MPEALALREAREWLRSLSGSAAETALHEIGRGTTDRTRDGPQLTAGSDITNKEEFPFAGPYYWAAFVLFGDPE
jgi:CHAT domain-containing protein